MPSETSVCKTVLPNGLRIVSEYVPYVESVSIGLWVNVGSRDESDENLGISHFVEHMLFKGTKSRSAVQIADEMDFLGGQLNAYTDKEYTCYYVKVLNEHTEKALDVLCDMLLNSVLDAQELEREKNVVLEEIKRHDDTPEDSVHDLLPKVAWNSHKLGNSVIGMEETVCGLSRNILQQYMNNLYQPDRTVLCVAGKVSHNTLVEMAIDRFAFLTDRSLERKLTPPIFCAGEKIVVKPTQQVHFCFGANGYNVNDSRKYALATLDNVLGGGMSSRLFQEIREKRGLTYSIGSYALGYSDAGLFVIYGSTSKNTLDEVLDLIRNECSNIVKNSISAIDLERAKNQVRSSMVLGQEGMANRMSRLAKSELYYGRIFDAEEVIESMSKVTQDDVTAAAHDLLGSGDFAYVAIGDI